MKKEIFFFPMNILLKWYKAIPVRGVKDKNAIYCVTQMLEESKNIHIVISPEGTRKKVIKWNKGFYYIANKANVPIAVVYLDYQKKEIGLKGVINSNENIKSIMQQINVMYENVMAKHPENFSLETNR
ncbi:MAG: acyltransferase [Paludibacter sp.]|nr:acyltransferase [Paludibacter sp.]